MYLNGGNILLDSVSSRLLDIVHGISDMKEDALQERECLSLSYQSRQMPGK